MTNSSHRPFEWAAVVNWSLSLFLLGLTTARTPFGSAMDRLALGLLSGIVWAVIGGLIVALWKYFKRSSAAGKAGHLDVTQNHDRALFIVAMVIAAFLVGKGLYLETYGSFIDAVILVALGFGVKAGLHFARWLFAVYAFVTPILVIGHGGGNAVIWPFVFFYTCRSIIVQGGSQLTDDTHAPQTEKSLQENTAMNYLPPNGAPSSTIGSGHHNSALPPTDVSDVVPPADGDQPTVDEDQIYSLIAEELETGVVDKGLWTRLFAQCGGDEKQAKVLYIKQRAERLISAERARLERMERERTAEIARLEKLRLQNLSRREKLMAQNITSELAEQVRELSKTHSAVTILNKVRLNQLADVLAMLNDNPLLVAVTNSDGDTPLHIAVREQYPKLVQLLIENGARVEVGNVFGITPIELANKSGKEDVVRMVTTVRNDAQPCGAGDAAR